MPHTTSRSGHLLNDANDIHPDSVTHRAASAFGFIPDARGSRPKDEGTTLQTITDIGLLRNPLSVRLLHDLVRLGRTRSSIDIHRRPIATVTVILLIITRLVDGSTVRIQLHGHALAQQAAAPPAAHHDLAAGDDDAFVRVRVLHIEPVEGEGGAEARLHRLDALARQALSGAPLGLGQELLVQVLFEFRLDFRGFPGQGVVDVDGRGDRVAVLVRLLRVLRQDARDDGAERVAVILFGVLQHLDQRAFGRLVHDHDDALPAGDERGLGVYVVFKFRSPFRLRLRLRFGWLFSLALSFGFGFGFGFGFALALALTLVFVIAHAVGFWLLAWWRAFFRLIRQWMDDATDPEG